MKATNSALQQLIEGTKVFAVPLYQRRYSWQLSNWREFWKNILEQYDFSLTESSTAVPVTHFIGSFVLAPAPGAASAPTRFILVDGQQRLTTTMVALAALRDLLADSAENDDARQAVVRKFNTLYLHNAFEADPEKKLRLLPTQQDRSDYTSCVGRTPADPQGRIGEAYDFFRSSKAMRGQDLQGEPLDLELVADILLGRLTLVEITTETGDNVHRIFQTLNSAGVKLKQVDLLRNHFFMLLPTRGESLYGTLWRDMELRLGEAQLDRFFWAELVRGDARVSRTDVYAAMQRRLQPIERDEDAVEEVLRGLNADSHAYLALIQPVDGTPAVVEERLKFLRDWGSETARPLILELIVRLHSGRIMADDVEQCLRIIQSFLVRRMIVGIPTNNLNRIFSSLTPTLSRSEAITPQSLSDALAEGQKYWPSDAQIREAARFRPFYFSGQPHQRLMLLERIAAHFAGKEPAIIGEQVSIEHILPQTAGEDWLEALDSDPIRALELHEQFVHTIGNLTLTGYNSELGNRSFEEKRELYAGSSIAMTRNLSTLTRWDSQGIEERSVLLADLLVEMWPGPELSKISIADLEAAVVEDALLFIPAHGLTTIGDLAELSGLPDSEVRLKITSLSPELQARVSTDPGVLPEGSEYVDASALSQLLADATENE